MSELELHDLAPTLNRKGTFRKNTAFVAGTQPTLDSFYFWLNGDSIWYAETLTSTAVLGQLKITGIEAGLNLSRAAIPVSRFWLVLDL
jgi:hypothetical protein